MKSIINHKFFLFALVVFFTLGFFPGFVFGDQKSASLFLSPSSGTYQAGSTFSISVEVGSQQEAMNAAEALLNFNPAIARVRSISKANSIFAFWPAEPSFSNTAGSINFTGGSPTNYRGSSGRIITIVFEALKEGNASIAFASGRVLASDGMGTDITNQLTGGNYTITKATTPSLPSSPSQPPSQPQSQLPVAPEITSPTHSDSEKWYNNNSPIFEWDTPSNANAIRVGISKDKKERPSIFYENATSSWQFEEVEDGIWYFSLQLRSQQGWGEIGSFEVKIDTTPPKSFEVEIDNGNDPTNPSPVFFFEAFDELSEIDYYEIILNEETYTRVNIEEVKEGYRISPLAPGDYVLTIKAFDKAGNFVLSNQKPIPHPIYDYLGSVYFSISPIPFQLEELPSKILEREPLLIRGITLPNTVIRIYIQKEDEEPFIKESFSNSDGEFQLEENFLKGRYFIWAEAEDRRGALSEATEKHFLEVESERFLFIILIVLIFLILLGIVLIWILWLGILKKKRKKEKEESKERAKEKQQAYLFLKRKVEEQIEYLEEKVDLNRGETRLLNNLKETLIIAEKERKEEENEEEYKK